MTSLNVRSLGHGIPVVLVHGWAMNSHMLDELAEKLAEQHRVLLVDLPGHGASKARVFGLDEVVDDLRMLVDEKAHWIGWSLGGTIVMQLAMKYPEKVRSLSLISATPRFVKGAGWDFAVDEDVLTAFSKDLEQDYHATIRRFLALQALGCASAKQTLKKLQQKVKSEDAPATESLDSGLSILRNTDLRTSLKQLACRVKVILGEKDTLVPAGVEKYYQETLQEGDVEVIEGAGHAPFISHAEEFNAALVRFLERSAGEK